MRMTRTMRAAAVTAAVLALTAAPAALAGGHTWDVNEVFTNEDGTIQFIELKETGGGAGEVGTAGHTVTSNTKTFTLTSNVASPTSFRHILLATATFAALPGAPTPDYIIPPGTFFNKLGDTVRYNPFDVWTFGAVPTNGVNSLNRVGGSQPNSPTNYAGQTGSVNANPPAAPPAVPDGTAGTTPMDVIALDQAGASLRISWDTSTCTDNSLHQIIYGEGSQLPSAPGATFGVTGSVCTMGATSPFTWNGAPAASDGTGLVWWLIVVRNAAGVEGSWGADSAAAERRGPGTNGSSGQCSVTSKDLTNACGH